MAILWLIALCRVNCKVKKGNTRDLALYASPLGFELTNIKIPVLAFSGLKDRNVPSAIASRVVQQVQNGKLIVYDEADHGTIFKHIDDIFEKNGIIYLRSNG